MNIEQWIKDNTNGYTRTVTIESLRKLFDIHAVVPREPSEDLIFNVWDDNTSCHKMDADETKETYFAMIKASEEEL